MKKGISRRRFLISGSATALSLAAGMAVAEAPLTSLRPVARGEDLRKRALTPVADLIAKARLDGQISFAVVRADTGALQEAHNGELGLPPASVAKALTATYALQALGPAHHFTTEVIVTGPVSEGKLSGDLVLMGGGDPTLDTDGLMRLAALVKDAGIREITGKFLVCGADLPHSFTIDAAQPDHVGYNPAVSGLNLNYNRVHFEWRRGSNGYSVSMDARNDSLRPAVHMARMGVVPRAAPIYTYSDTGGRDEWTVARDALGSGGSRWLPVRKPEIYAGEVFQTLAGSHGLRLPAPEVVGARPLGVTVAQIDSPPLRIILRDMLKWSTNLTAEVVGQAATKARTGQVLSIPQSAEQMSVWARERFDLSHVALVDHSGLGEASRISAADMAAALVAAHKAVGIKPLLKSIPMRDERRRVLPDHPLSVHAKTGTLNFVSGLAGFIDTPEGDELIFAIFAGDLARRGKLTKAQRERPEGASSWNTRAKILQQALIDRWGILYAG